MPTPLTMYRTELNGYRENVMNAWKAYQEAIDALGEQCHFRAAVLR